MLFYNCGCFFTHNIFIKEIKHHFNFFNTEQFFKDYNKILYSLDCDSESKKRTLLQKILEEVDRRKSKDKRDAARREFLKKFYHPLDERLYVLEEDYFHPSFIKIIKAVQQSNLQRVLKFLDVLSEEKQVYGFPLFKKEFCDKLVNELAHYNDSNMPKERPNTMNENGVLLDDIGFHDKFSFVLRSKYLDPLVHLLFPEWRGQGLDSHKIFTVQYKMTSEDSELSYHYDNSEVTLNVCLGKTFKGGEIYFGDMNSVPISESTCILIPHKRGYGLLHRGRQMHGALNVTAGERCNLIMWMRSSSVRNKMCPMCNLTPSNLTLAFQYGDGFTLDNSKINKTCWMF